MPTFVLVSSMKAITHDPYTMTFGQRGVFVDMGAEQVMAAEKPIAQPVLQDLRVPVLTFEAGKERIVQWIR